jgi:cytochrome c oxidase assembly protein subunit 15
MAEPTIRDRASSRLVECLARAAVIATLVLIVAGGLVTSRDAGLAVPDWPLSFGTLNPPRWYTIVNVRTEHGHRLIAASVALLTAILGWVVYRKESRPAVRRLASAAVGLVLFQALLGGLRVLHLSVDLAMVHALTGQLFLAVVVTLATVTSRRWPDATLEPASRPEVRLDALLVAVILTQLVLGILIRHGGDTTRPLLTQAMFQAHVVVALTIAWIAFRRRSRARLSGNPLAARRSTTTVWLVYSQLALGLFTFFVTDAMTHDRQASLLESWVPTLHVAVGAGVLAAAVRSLAYSLAAPRLDSCMAVAQADVRGATR